MSWSIDRRPIKHPRLVQKVLLTAGKALYLANLFEDKCRYILRIGELEALIQENPDSKLNELLQLGSKPSNPRLKPIVERVGKLAELDLKTKDVFSEGVNARNFIAHKGALFGYVGGATVKHLKDQLVELEKNVQKLLEADAIVSTWMHCLEEKEAPTEDFVKEYPSKVMAWLTEEVNEEA